MRKTVRGVGREPSHKERGFSPKMSQPKGSFGTARLGTGSQPGAGSLPMRHGGPGMSTMRKISAAPVLPLPPKR
jgi:hypothetical protein